MRRVVEVVTCDQCGREYPFEKYNQGARLFRMESLTEWLRAFGWRCDIQNARDSCPQCVRSFYAAAGGANAQEDERVPIDSEDR